MATRYAPKKSASKKGKGGKPRSMSMNPKSVGLHRRQCRNKHPLKKTTNMRTETCADCRAKVGKNGTMHACKACRFHVCKVCYSKPACNNGHSLTSTKAPKNGIICGNAHCNYKGKKGLTFKHCRLCKYFLCLGCYGNETCPGNHGLRLSKPSQLNDKTENNSTEMKTAANTGNTGNTGNNGPNNVINKQKSTSKLNLGTKESTICSKCYRVFDKPNIPLFLCNECKYYLCGDCYQPSILFHRKRKEKLKNSLKNGNKNGNGIIIVAPKAKVASNGNGNGNGNENENENKNEESNSNDDNSNMVVSTQYSNDEKNNSEANLMIDHYYWGTDDENGNVKNESMLTPTGGHSGSKSDTCVDEFAQLGDGPPNMTRIPSIATECIICMETNKSMAFQPCGHYISCDNCANLMMLEGSCPICSSKISGLFRIFE